jgi:hypothetical protein
LKKPPVSGATFDIELGPFLLAGPGIAAALRGARRSCQLEKTFQHIPPANENSSIDAAGQMS